jgi:hypothetical protein
MAITLARTLGLEGVGKMAERGVSRGRAGMKILSQDLVHHSGKVAEIYSFMNFGLTFADHTRVEIEHPICDSVGAAQRRHVTSHRIRIAPSKCWIS